MLIPARRRGEEILDRPGLDPVLVTRSMGDVAKANALFGGVSAALAELGKAVPDLAASASLLDVATGVGDIPRAATRFLGGAGVRVTSFGLDAFEALARASRKNTTASLCANGLALPFAEKSIDVVMCSQFLHHLLPDEAVTLIREMNRVARVRVIISDLRRSWVAAGGLWIASFPLRFHPISRHDGVVSVMRGFTRAELRQIISRALGIDVAPTSRRTFRITASWAPITS